MLCQRVGNLQDPVVRACQADTEIDIFACRATERRIKTTDRAVGTCLHRTEGSPELIVDVAVTSRIDVRNVKLFVCLGEVQSLRLPRVIPHGRVGLAMQEWSHQRLEGVRFDQNVRVKEHHDFAVAVSDSEITSIRRTSRLTCRNNRYWILRKSRCQVRIAAIIDDNDSQGLPDRGLQCRFHTRAQRLFRVMRRNNDQNRQQLGLRNRISTVPTRETSSARLR